MSPRHASRHCGPSLVDVLLCVETPLTCAEKLTAKSIVHLTTNMKLKDGRTENKTRPAVVYDFYRAMHFSAKRGIAIACRLSVRPSVCLSVCLSVTLVNCDHIGWNSSKIISPLVSLGCSLFATPT